jgi:hypothetical protein
MTWKQIWILPGLGIGLLFILFWVPGRPAAAQPVANIFASPVHAGCYLAKNDRCKIHVEPFTLNLATGQKLVQFQLVAAQMDTGVQRTIYDFRPDQSNPLPGSGTTYTPSLVAKDFGATCSQSYTISLQGQATGDLNSINLGITTPFTCPKGDYIDYLPLINK